MTWRSCVVLAGILAALGVSLAACNKSTPVSPPAACVFQLSATTLTFAAGGGTNAVTVAAASHCAWTAVSDRAWMSITSGASGTGNGVVTIAVGANGAETARTGTLTIAGQAVTVQEEGLQPCTFDIAPSTASYGTDAASGSFSVTAPAPCAWTAASTASWLQVTGGSPGAGDGTVFFAVERNLDPASRAGAITVGARTFSVAQAGDAGACEYAVTPVTFTPCMSVPFELTASLTTSAGCTWTATPDVSWLTLLSPATGTGSTQIRFRVAENWLAPREGRVQVRWPTPTAGQNLIVNQAGCSYAVTVQTFSVAASGGTRQFDVFQQSIPVSCGGPLQDACLWTAEADVPWITVSTPMPQRGDNRVTFAVAPNTGPARSGTITVRSQVVQITQAGQ